MRCINALSMCKMRGVRACMGVWRQIRSTLVAFDFGGFHAGGSFRFREKSRVVVRACIFSNMLQPRKVIALIRIKKSLCASD